MKPDWILIANATHARLLQHERGKPMAVLKSFEHSQGRTKIGELADDRAGQGKTDHDFGGATYSPHVDAKHKEHTRFAHELSEQLERHAQQGSFQSLTIFASNPFLGQLKAELAAATSRLLSGTHELDLTSFDLRELEQRIERELAR